MNPVIAVEGLCKSYGSLQAVDDVSFEVRQGEMFGLSGPDGAGKSTIYRILATITSPDSGKAEVLGMDVTRDYRRIRTRIGYMPDRFSLYQDLSIMENLNFFALIFGVSVKANYDLIAPVFGQLEKFPHRKAGALSGGMKQKLALCCALIHRPEILLLDEPTTGVDAVSRSEFWDMLATLKDQGISILVSTSYMDEATRCERISIIDKGRLLDTGTPAGLTSRLGDNLYHAVARDMFGLLNRLRALPGVEDCYTFGATLHVVGNDGFDPGEAEQRLRSDGLADVRIYPATGDIEDLFIKLTTRQRQ